MIALRWLIAGNSWEGCDNHVVKIWYWNSPNSFTIIWKQHFHLVTEQKSVWKESLNSNIIPVIHCKENVGLLQLLVLPVNIWMREEVLPSVFIHVRESLYARNNGNITSKCALRDSQNNSTVTFPGCRLLFSHLSECFCEVLWTLCCCLRSFSVYWSELWTWTDENVQSQESAIRKVCE